RSRPKRWPPAETRARDVPEIPACPPALPGSASIPGRARLRAAQSAMPGVCSGSSSPSPAVRRAAAQRKRHLSAVARRAIGEAIVLVYLVDLHQLAAAAKLVGRRLPGHVVDLVVGPQMPFRLPVAIDAPLHVQG